MTRVAIVHDYLTQRGGAERVVLAMARAFPGAPIYTSVFDPAGTFPEFSRLDVRTSWLQRLPWARTRARALLPLLAPTFSGLTVSADLVLCSSSGWAHGVRAEHRKVVYCHTPAHWLYQPEAYLGASRAYLRPALAVVSPVLRAWDRRAAASADLYLTQSHAVRRRVREQYGRDAELLPAPPGLMPGGPETPVPGVEGPFLLSVGRLLEYKNVRVVVEAMRGRSERLVLAGSGPLMDELRRTAPGNVVFAGAVDDGQLRWLYSRCDALVAAAHEDYGLAPLEAAAWGKPTVALRWGGFLDTVVEGETGIFFDEPTANSLRGALDSLAASRFDRGSLAAHAARYTEDRFIARLQEIERDPGTGGSAAVGLTGFDRAWDDAAGVEGWLTEAQARRLFDAAAALPADWCIVEVGSHHGRSTMVLARAHAGGEVVAVDPFDDARWGGGTGAWDAFQANLKRSGVTNVRPYRGLSAAAAAGWGDEPVGMVFIDGAHDLQSVLDDLDGWLPRIVPGGSLFIHDAFSAPGVTRAVLARLLFNPRFAYSGHSGTLVGFRRVEPGRAASAMSAARLMGLLPYQARNLMVKVAMRRKWAGVTRLLRHRGADFPY